ARLSGDRTLQFQPGLPRLASKPGEIDQVLITKIGNGEPPLLAIKHQLQNNHVRATDANKARLYAAALFEGPLPSLSFQLAVFAESPGAWLYRRPAAR